MDTLRWFFFESTIALGAVLFLFAFGLLVYWRRGGSPRPLLVALLVGVVLLIVQAAVVTPREWADRLMRQVQIDVLASQTQRMAGVLAPSFRITDEDWGRDDFLELVRSYYRRLTVRSLRRRLFEVGKVRDDVFTLTVSYLAEVETRDFSGPVLSRWEIEFVRSDGVWRIGSIRPVEINHRPVQRWRRLPRVP